MALDTPSITMRRTRAVHEIRTVSTQELQRGLDRDSGLHLLNVQTDRFFTGELIPGSRRIPLDNIERRTKHLSRDAEIVTYCGGPACSQSIQAALALRALGFANVCVYKEGLEGWKTAGNGIVAPEPVRSM
jgi:ArsR family transcriptional regulator